MFIGFFGSWGDLTCHFGDSVFLCSDYKLVDDVLMLRLSELDAEGYHAFGTFICHF